jgi:glycine cleavage system H lipoate-binding protein
MRTWSSSASPTTRRASSGTSCSSSCRKSELYSPLAGEVVAVNDRLDKEPALVNSAPFGDGWMIKLRLKDAKDKDALMNAAAYEAHVGH